MKSRLIKLLTKRRIKGLILLGISLVLALMTLCTNRFVEQMLSAVSIVCLLIGLDYILITPELGKKITLVIEEILLFITKKVFYYIRKIISKFSFSNGKSFKGARMIKGYSDITEHINENGSVVKSKKRHKRYKNMDNIEKVRFLYEKKVTGAIKKGVPIEESMTPNEAGETMKTKKYMKKSEDILIGTYNVARYDDEAIITDEMVKRIKG